MPEIPWDILISTVAVLITVALGFYRVGRWTKAIEERFKKIESPVQLLVVLHRKEIIDFYSRSWGSAHRSNPSTEKDILLRKLRKGTITRDESLRLREILENERRMAIRAGAIMAALAIGGLLLLIAIILGGEGEG